MDNGLAIRAIGLRKNFPKVTAVDGLSLEVARGEVVCIIGPNGAGKTTLLLLLGGVIFPSAGHVTVLGRDRWKENFAIRKQSAFLPVNPIVGESPTPYEYLRFLAQIYGLPREAQRATESYLFLCTTIGELLVFLARFSLRSFAVSLRIFA